MDNKIHDPYKHSLAITFFGIIFIAFIAGVLTYFTNPQEFNNFSIITRVSASK